VTKALPHVSAVVPAKSLRVVIWAMAVPVRDWTAARNTVAVVLTTKAKLFKNHAHISMRLFSDRLDLWFS